MSLAVLPLWIYLTALMIAPVVVWADDCLVHLLICSFWILSSLRGRWAAVSAPRKTGSSSPCCLDDPDLDQGGLRANIVQLLIEYTKWFVVYRLVAVSIDSIRNLRRAAFAFLFFGVLLAVEELAFAVRWPRLGRPGICLDRS
jgi:hypothetical protein